MAAREAWADAGTPDVDPERLGVTVTSGIGGIGSTLAAYDTLKEKGWQRISPYTVPMLMPNGSAGWISMEIGARAGAHSLVSACASGAEAIGYGIDMIRSGRADVVLAGGTEAAIMPLNIGAFAVMRAMSTRNDEPERASRPFDKARDGFVLGEGAGMLVLESLSHARQRDATVYAIAAGAGYSSDAYHIAHPAPDGAGVIAAITRALADAQVDPTRVVHVNAHATSTPEGDTVEAQALAKALGAAIDGVVVTSTKSMTGHLLGGAGAIESVAAILALREHVAPPTINLEAVPVAGGLDADEGEVLRRHLDRALQRWLRFVGRSTTVTVTVYSPGGDCRPTSRWTKAGTRLPPRPTGASRSRSSARRGPCPWRRRPPWRRYSGPCPPRRSSRR